MFDTCMVNRQISKKKKNVLSRSEVKNQNEKNFRKEKKLRKGKEIIN